MAPEKTEALKAFLGKLPSQMASGLARAIESERLTGSQGLPYDLILSGLRPVLRDGATERIPTPLRLFCRPFEDLLIPAHEIAKVKGRIARASISPIWAWLAERLMPTSHAALTDALAQALLAGDADVIGELSARLYREASAAILEGLPRDDGKRMTLAKRLGGDAVLADAEEIAGVLAIAGEIAALKAHFPRPHEELTEADCDYLRDHYEGVCETAPDSSAYVLIVAMARLEAPWQIMRAAAKIAHSEDDFLMSRTDVGALGELLFHDLDTLASRLDGVSVRDLDPEAVVRDLSLFVRISQGFTKEIGVRRDGVWGQRLMALRGRVSARMEQVLGQCVREVAGAMPTRRKAGLRPGGVPTLDGTVAFDPARADRACSLARLVSECGPVAKQIAFGVAVSDALAAMRETLEEFGPAVLRALEEEDDAAALELPRAYLDLAVRLMRHIQGEEDAEILRRRGAMAAAPRD